MSLELLGTQHSLPLHAHNHSYLTLFLFLQIWIAKFNVLAYRTYPQFWSSTHFLPLHSFFLNEIVMINLLASVALFGL